MQDPTQPRSGIVRFGVFEVDFQARELLKHGLRIKLQEKPFRVLAALLEVPGKLVTREELRERLWQSETYVDFDRGVNIAINKLRVVLSDSADNPRFVETLSRRGYRFIAPVHGPLPPESLNPPTNLNSGSSEEATKLKGGAEPISSVTDEIRSVPPATRRSRLPDVIWYVLMFAGTALIVASFLELAIFRTPDAPKVLGYVQLTSDGQAKSGRIIIDGSRMYFGEGKEGIPLEVEASSSGGQTALIALPTKDSIMLDFSPIRSEILTLASVGTQGEAPLWVMPVPAGSPHRLGTIVANKASWSPDGQKLAYTHDLDLYIAKADASEPRKLVTLAGTAGFLLWSPDGKRIRFSMLDEKTGATRLCEVFADGSDLHTVLPGWTNEWMSDPIASWTANGKYYVFSSFRDGRSDLWALPEKGDFISRAKPQPARLTAGPMNFTAPAVSIDGKKLYAIGSLPRGELVRFDSRTQQFIPFLGGMAADGLAFSHDGEWVAYIIEPERTLWRSRIDGSQPLQLTFPPMKALLPRWSPDARRIAFMAQTPGRPWKILTISPEGGSPEQLMPGDRNEGNPTWSSDGNSLAFAGVPWVTGFTSGTTAVHILDFRSHQISTLPGSEGLWSPRWSPDGHAIAAISTDSQKLRLYNFETRQWSELAQLSIAYTAWSHDSKYVYVGSFSTDDPTVYRVRLADRSIERVVSLKGQRQAWTLGPWFGLAPDDSPLILRDIGAQEVYALDVQLP